MNPDYVNPSVFSNPAPDGVNYNDFVDFGGNPAQDGLSWEHNADYNDAYMSDFNARAPVPQSYQNTTAAAQQQFLDSITAADVSNESFTAQLGHGYDAATSFPFPTQAASQSVETLSTAPSTSRSPESSPQNNDSPSTTNTTSTEANPQPPARGARKRGRKPRVIKDKAEEDRLRRNFLERNRIAASKCREKKRDETERMQNDAHELKQENERLKWDVEWLRGYIDFLKEALQPHVDVNCVDDQEALTAMGRRNKKLAVRQTALAKKPLDLDGMSYESEGDEFQMKEERQISVDSGVADLSTPIQVMPANPFSA